MSSPHRPIETAAIIPRSPETGELPRWQKELAEAFIDPHELLSYLELDANNFAVAEAATHAFPQRVPRPFAERMRKGDPADPLLLQVLPQAKEMVSAEGFTVDPVGDLAARSGVGMLRKYMGRALVLATPACAVHCRYCFRRHFPYADHSLRSEQMDALVRQLNDDPSITELILSGGDPLTLSDRRLTTLFDRLASLHHLKRLRLHTRLPIVLPSRVTDELLRTLSGIPFPVVVVLHINHPNELDSDTRKALARLRTQCDAMLNQAVLLKGVNDDIEVLERLFIAGFDAGVQPYYLHMLDRVAGSAAFEVAESTAIRLMQSLRERLPGYLMPRLVREVSGRKYKYPISY